MKSLSVLIINIIIVVVVIIIIIITFSLFNFLFQSLTRDISHSMENLAIDSLLR